MHRLETLSVELAHALDHATPAQRREALRFACRSALEETGLANDDVTAVQMAIERGTDCDPALAVRLDALTKALDESYFQLADEGRPNSDPELRRFFRRARAAAALYFAISAKPDALADAIYEAVAALDDRAGLLHRLVELLSPP